VLVHVLEEDAQMVRPPLIVVITIGDELAACRVQTLAPRSANSAVFAPDQANPSRQEAPELHRGIAAIVNDNDFQVVSVLTGHRPERSAQGLLSIEGTDNNADQRVLAAIH
jgi:hypothetical protein